MRKDEPILLLAALAVCAFAVGCVSQKADHVRYVDPGEIVAGTPEQATMYDLESSAQALMQKMLASRSKSQCSSAREFAAWCRLESEWCTTTLCTYRGQPRETGHALGWILSGRNRPNRVTPFADSSTRGF